MSKISLSGNDTTQIAGRVLTGFGNGDVVKLTFPNDLVGVTVGKNGNSLFNGNATGQLVEVEVRVLRGSADDSFLNNLLVQQKTDLPSFTVMSGYFVKRIGDGQGNIMNDTYILGGGVFVRNVDAAENVEGNTDPALSIYRMKFSNSDRAQF